MKILYIILVILMVSCTTVKQVKTPVKYSDNLTVSMTNEINESIIDGFFNNDTANITKGTYFLK